MAGAWLRNKTANCSGSDKDRAMIAASSSAPRPGTAGLLTAWSALISGLPETDRTPVFACGATLCSRPLADGGADEAVPGDQGGQGVLVQAVGVLRRQRQHQVAGLGVGVPHPDLGALGQLQAELGQYRARLPDHPGTVGEALVPARRRAE